MPELPEVETIVRSLSAPADSRQISDSFDISGLGIVGKSITSSEVFWRKSVAFPEVEKFLNDLPGQTIKSVSRRGKFIVISLTRQYLLFHLRMSGDLYSEQPVADRVETHDRIRVNFTDGTRLVFNDTRKFGRAWLVQDADSVLGGLGPEPLAPEFAPEFLFEKLQHSKKQIKPLLLDQSFIAGMGNIYTDEALFTAKIHPLTQSHLLNKADAKRLHEAIQEVLLEGIKRNGASIDWVYRGGDFQNYFKVYHRHGEKCVVCGTTIERISVGQRGTHFCPHCQPKKIKR